MQTTSTNPAFARIIELGEQLLPIACKLIAIQVMAGHQGLDPGSKSDMASAFLGVEAFLEDIIPAIQELQCEIETELGSRVDDSGDNVEAAS